MRSLRRAAARFRDAGSIPLLLTGLLLATAAAPLSAGERSRPSSSSDMGGRTAQPRSGGGDHGGGGHSSPPPSYSPPPSSGGGGGGSDRHAVPRGSGGGSDRGEPSRQRPHNPSGGGGYHGGGYGHGYYGGYYGYPYYYYGPYWGWGWGWGWWWDDYYYYGRAGYYGYPYGAAGYYDRYAGGALDIDVSPGKTEVWIDGRYTGTADDFDGFPQYLWLDAGTYDVVLFREGYKTIARQVSIRPGQVIGMGDRLQPGESVRPENLATKTHERRDERVRSEEERRDAIAREGDGLDDWRERARQRMNERNAYGHEEGGEAEVSAPDDDVIGRLHVNVDPADASVYVDGRFVGTGIDLQRVRNGLRLEPGEHRIAVVRPGRKAVEQSFTVAVGEEVELEFDLESLE